MRIDQDGIGFGHGERSLWLDATGPAGDDPGGERALRLAAIRAGWPSLPARVSGTLLPPALGLEHLGAVSFAKGCYPGQEIAARLHYRGGHKAGLYRVVADSGLAIGEPVFPDSPSAGVVLDAVAGPAGFEALVVLNHDINDLEKKLNVIERFAA